MSESSRQVGSYLEGAPAPFPESRFEEGDTLGAALLSIQLEINKLLLEVARSTPERAMKIDQKIQALRYMQGEWLIRKNGQKDSQLSEIELNKVTHQAQRISQSEGVDPEVSIAGIQELLVRSGYISAGDEGARQLRIARDIAQLALPRLNQQHALVSERSDGHTSSVNRSQCVQVSEEAWEAVLAEGEKPLWLEKMLKKVGLSSGDNWVEHFFNSFEKDIIREGHSIDSSVRFIPIPANWQHNETRVKVEESDGVPARQCSLQWEGIGTLALVEQTSMSLQDKKEYAAKMFAVVMKQQLEEAIQRYIEIYGKPDPDNPPPFMVSYQTLLSPILIDLFGAKDNNSLFVEISRYAIEKFKVDNAAYLAKLKANHGVVVEVDHTNTSINDLSDKNSGNLRKFKLKGVATHSIVWDYSDTEDKVRQKVYYAANALQDVAIKARVLEERGVCDYLRGKEGAVVPDAGTLLRIEKAINDSKSEDVSPAARKDIIMRMYASVALTKLLNNEQPFDNLATYQRNLMRAALESLCCGAQSLSVAGCKSARDRTAVFAAALSTMMSDFKAMENFESLSVGIGKELKAGHRFKTMMHHAILVKLSDVHKEFESIVRPSMLRAIKQAKQYCRVTNYISQTAWGKFSQRMRRMTVKGAAKNVGLFIAAALVVPAALAVEVVGRVCSLGRFSAVRSIMKKVNERKCNAQEKELASLRASPRVQVAEVVYQKAGVGTGVIFNKMHDGSGKSYQTVDDFAEGEHAVSLLEADATPVSPPPMADATLEDLEEKQGGQRVPPSIAG